ncbi:MAG: hypothetical protein J7M19_02215 [Planctomycetes bacterium]|nr:hypothetical protein [Planctomycetota bacterium]
MGSRLMSRGLRLGAVVLLGTLLCGCFEYTQEININDDGSGEVRVTAWIDANVAGRFRADVRGGEIPAPIRKAVIRDITLGSKQVKLTDMTVVLEGDRWVYEITLAFQNAAALAKTKFFRRMHPSLDFVSTKQLRFKEGLTTTLIDIARDRAKTLNEDIYAENFLKAVDTDEFKSLVADAKLTYVVTMPGRTATGNSDRVEGIGDDRIRASWDFTMKNLLDQRAGSTLEITSTLPPERGFSQIVIVLLLLAVVGMLVPAIRLVILKVKGAS